MKKDKIDYIFVGWKKEGKSDKVWGAIKLVESGIKTGIYKVLIFWGKRDTAYQTQIKTDYMLYSTRTKIDEKLKKGYIKYSEKDLEQISPDLKKDLEKTVFWSAMTKASDLGEEAFHKFMENYK